MKKTKIGLVTMVSVFLTLLTILTSSISPASAWWVGWYAGFDVTVEPDFVVDPWMNPPCPAPYIEVNGQCGFYNTLPDGTVVGFKVAVDNLHRLYDMTINAYGFAIPGFAYHLEVYAVKQSDFLASAEKEPDSAKTYVKFARPYGIDTDINGEYTFSTGTWEGFEPSCYSFGCYGDDRILVFYFEGVFMSQFPPSLSFDFLYLMQNRGDHNSVDSPPVMTIYGNSLYQLNQYNTYLD